MNEFHLYNLGRVDYTSAFNCQKRFIEMRHAETIDEIWCLEHSPVYTLGLSGKSEHILDCGSIPVVHTDRGGQVTYHGPGQLVVYPLLDLKRRNITVKKYVNRLEQAIIDTLAQLGIIAHRASGAPGVYVDEQKIAALGIRIRKGYCYHGISLNIDMDLAPFNGINPCGYKGLKVTQLKNLGIDVNIAELIPLLARSLVTTLDYETYTARDNIDLGRLHVM